MLCALPSVTACPARQFFRRSLGVKPSQQRGDPLQPRLAGMHISLQAACTQQQAHTTTDPARATCQTWSAAVKAAGSLESTSNTPSRQSSLPMSGTTISDCVLHSTDATVVQPIAYHTGL